MAAVTQITALKNKAAKLVDRKLRGFTRGLVKLGKLIEGDSLDIVPVDYGNLKATAFIRTEGANTKHVVVTVGYTAPYAIYVHEDLDKAHGAAFNAKYAVELAHVKALRRKRQGGTTGPFRHNRGENQQAKFLEKPFRQWKPDAMKLVKAEVAAP